MIPAWKALLFHADDERLPAMLDACGYRPLLERGAAQERALWAELSASQRTRLEELLQTERSACFLEMECLFQAALALGMELGRL